MKITLTPTPLKNKKIYHEVFYVEQKENGSYWMGHQHNDVGDTHEVRISEKLYLEFIKESQANAEKYEKIIPSN